MGPGCRAGLTCPSLGVFTSFILSAPGPSAGRSSCSRSPKFGRLLLSHLIRQSFNKRAVCGSVERGVLCAVPKGEEESILPFSKRRKCLYYCFIFSYAKIMLTEKNKINTLEIKGKLSESPRL